MSNSPIEVYRASVLESWIDYNGHMNEGYYAVAFGDATDAYLIRAGFDDTYRGDIGGTFYTVETHIRYVRELKLGDPLLFRTTVLGADAKKLHLFHSMVHEIDGYEAATQEASCSTLTWRASRSARWAPISSARSKPIVIVTPSCGRRGQETPSGR